MPWYRVCYEIEADDSDGAIDLGPTGASDIYVKLLDEPEEEE